MTRLTSVANVKRFLAVPTTNQDALISQLITRESGTIERKCSRLFGYRDNTRYLNGTGTAMLVLPDTPIRAVSSLMLGTLAVLPTTANNPAGFVFSDTAVELTAARFPDGFKNITVSWSAGWRGTGVAITPAGIPPDANFPLVGPPVTFTVDDMTFNAALFPDGELDVGYPLAAVSVSDANGVAFNQVASSANGPLTGEFSFLEGVWSFNIANALQVFTCVFDYCPSQIEQACIEMVGLDLKQRDNLGVTSRSLAGESISYEKSGMPRSVLEMLNPFIKRVI